MPFLQIRGKYKHWCNDTEYSPIVSSESERYWVCLLMWCLIPATVGCSWTRLYLTDETLTIYCFQGCIIDPSHSHESQMATGPGRHWRHWRQASSVSSTQQLHTFTTQHPCHMAGMVVAQWHSFSVKGGLIKQNSRLFRLEAFPIKCGVSGKTLV